MAVVHDGDLGAVGIHRSNDVDARVAHNVVDARVRLLALQHVVGQVQEHFLARYLVACSFAFSELNIFGFKAEETNKGVYDVCQPCMLPTYLASGRPTTCTSGCE